MNTHLLLLTLFLCIIAACARHTDNANSDPEEINANIANEARGEKRHRRKRYHMSYGYDYQPPSTPFYYPQRREYDRNQDLLPEIYRLLDEISTYIRRPPLPPPPQPIYIPYAIPYPVCNCETGTKAPKKDKPTSLDNRFGFDDSNQNWGLVDDGSVEDDGDGTRPIQFTPIAPKKPMSRQPLPVDHGTQHARAIPPPQSTIEQPHIPDMCDVFALSCCSGDPSMRKACFNNAGCANTYKDDSACDKQRLLKIIDEYSRAYAPTQ